MRKLLFVFFLLFFLPSAGSSQSAEQSGSEKARIEILNADNVFLDDPIAHADRLIGHVRFKYKDAIMRCDSAHRFSNGDFEAFSHVTINQGDSLRLFGDRLYVTNLDKRAKLRENIRLQDKDLTLSTEILDYDLESGVASYFNGGKIVSSSNSNVLTSEQGFYDSETEFFYFRDSVLLKSRRYTVYSDTLKYSGASETAFFFGPTTIVSDNSTIECTRGWYNTLTGICQFTQRAEIWSGTNYLAGDSIYYDSDRGFGEVFGHVAIEDSTSSYFISGEYGWHNEATEKSLVTGHAEMLQYGDTDTLFLHADTLQAYADHRGKKLISAYHHVKFFRSDLQGKSDSLSYAEGDSLLQLMGNPVLWSEENQISGQKIDIRISKGKIFRMDIYQSAMIISEAATECFNQIKGRDLIGYFSDNELVKVLVKGNGQLVYFPVSESEDKQAIGVNRADCSDVMIYIKDHQINRIALINQPSGALHPLAKAATTDRTLEGFFWDVQNRPQQREDIFYWHEELSTDQ